MYVLLLGLRHVRRSGSTAPVHINIMLLYLYKYTIFRERYKTCHGCSPCSFPSFVAVRRHAIVLVILSRVESLYADMSIESDMKE